MKSNRRESTNGLEEKLELGTSLETRALHPGHFPRITGGHISINQRMLKLDSWGEENGCGSHCIAFWLVEESRSGNGGTVCSHKFTTRFWAPDFLSVNLGCRCVPRGLFPLVFEDDNENQWNICR